MINLNIDTRKLKPHPKNPRLDLGDISELTASIRAKGILQPLTVVAEDEDFENYTIVIGHRRFAAAKAAHLVEVPCTLVEMTEAEQVETMLMENMQRSDLTPYEEAQGFQMMMELGTSKSEISQKTGFSRTTIDHRLKLLELDQKELKDKSSQISMTELIMLEKIKDSETKNKLLREYKTPMQFKGDVDFAARKERAAERKKEVLVQVEDLIRNGWNITLLKEHPGYAGYNYRCLLSYDRDIVVKDELENVTLSEDDPIYLFETGYNNAFTAYLKVDVQQDRRFEESPEQKERQKKIAKLKEKSASLDQLYGAAGTHIRNWLRDWAEKREDVDKDELFRMLASSVIFDDDLPSISFFDDYAHLILPEYEDLNREACDDEDAFRERHGCSFDEYIEKAMKDIDPARLIFLAVSYGANINCAKAGYQSCREFVIYKRDTKAEALYQLIQAHGYVPDEWELKLLDGTHECYAAEDELLE